METITMDDGAWRYDAQERQMMAQIGIAIPPVAEVPQRIANETERFQRKFMKVTHADGSVTDGNGDPWHKSA